MTKDTRIRIILWVVCSVGILLVCSGGFLVGLSGSAEEITVKYTGLMFGGYNAIVGLSMITLSFYLLFKLNEERVKVECHVAEMH